MILRDWIAAARDASLPPLRNPPPVPLFPHQTLGARRLLATLRTVGGALLLDEVGMGKSFTAATVLREAAATGDAGAVLAPRPLVETWRATLARFGADATVGSHDTAADFPRSVHHPSLLVIDEAHRFRNPRTRRYARLAAACPGRRLLLVTATPLCNRLDDLHILVRLAAADDALKRWGIASIDLAFEKKDFSGVREILAILAVRRSPAGEALTFPGTVRRVVRFDLGSGAAAVARGVRELSVPLLARGQGPELLRRHFWRRYESSPEAFRESMRRQARFYRRAREKLLAGFSLTRRDFNLLFDSEDDFYQELLFPQIFLEAKDGNPAVLDEELAKIEALVALSRRGEPDKIAMLTRLVEEPRLRPALVFTSAVATAMQVHTILSRSLRAGVATSRLASDAHGEASTLERLLAELRARRLDALVLTDLAAEGLDLQAAASIVHFDLPWTAVKVRQRSGRAIRIGQVRPEIPVVFFLPHREARSGPVRAVSRKRRLADAILIDDPFSSPVSTAGSFIAGSVRAGTGVATLFAGVPAVRIEGRWSFDPKGIAGLADAGVSAVDAAEKLGAPIVAAAAIPPRIAQRDPFRSVLAALVRDRRSGDSMLERALRTRFRAGVEAALGDAIRADGGMLDGILEAERARTMSEGEIRDGAAAHGEWTHRAD